MALEIVVGNKEIEATKVPPDALGLNAIDSATPGGIKIIMKGFFFTIKLIYYISIICLYFMYKNLYIRLYALFYIGPTIKCRTVR